MAIILKHEQYDFTAGLVTTLGPNHTPVNGAYKLQNAMVHLGGFRKIYGTTKLNAYKIDDIAILSLYRVYVGTVVGTKSCLLATAGTAMYYWTGGIFTAIKTGLTAGKKWSFVTYNEIVYATNGTDTPLKIDITPLPNYPPTVTNMTGPANLCKYFIVVKERLWAGGNVTYPDRAWYCSINSLGIGQPETWNANNYLSFPSESSGETVMGLGLWKGNLIVFTDNTVCMLTGNNDTEFSLTIIDTRSGCSSAESVAQLGSDLIFLGRGGVYLFSGSRVHLLSKNIKREILDINPTYIGNAVAIADDQCYYLSYTSTAAGGTVNNRILIFDTRIGEPIDGIIEGGWTGPHTIGASSMVYYYGTSDSGQLYYGDAGATGFVHQFMHSTSTNFSGSAIDMDIESGEIDFSGVGAGLDKKKRFEELIVIAEIEGDYNLTAAYFLENSSTATTVGTVNLATSGKQEGDRDDTTNASRTIIIYPCKFRGNADEPISGYFLRPRFRQNGTGCKAIIRGFVLTAEILE
ncbi:MAG: hypothetical protein QME51_04220 [Planctomycetota bacterium]|nr:hypothetical protein [Planctomycetota bacterium]